MGICIRNDYVACEISGLMKAADRALNALRGMRSGLSVGKDKRKMKSEMHKLFPQCKKRKTCVWKHRFVCLAYRDQEKIPTTDGEKDDLLQAGLGEKAVEFSSLDCSAEEFREILYDCFPKLRDGGGYQLCRCLSNSRKLEPLTALVCSSPAVLKDRVGNARTYIRPLQRDLDMDSVYDITSMVRECNQERHFS